MDNLWESSSNDSPSAIRTILSVRGATEDVGMKKFKLARVSYTQYGTFGVLMETFGGGAVGFYDLPVCVTLENPWIQNLRSVSCIPLGLYKCERVQSPRFGETFEVTGVHERDHILFHKGNTEIDTSGCILLGNRFGHLSGTPAILESNAAYTPWMDSLAGQDSFDFAIIDAPGGVPYQE